MFKQLKEKFGTLKKRAKKPPKILCYEELEERVLFSADVMAGLDSITFDEQVLVEEVSSADPLAHEVAPAMFAQPALAASRELVFVDQKAPEYEQLIADLQAGDKNRIIEVVVLDANRDGIEQVGKTLSERSNLAAVHFIAHGAEGQINLGNNWLNSATLQQNSAAISAWGDALTEKGDFLFYGCNIAADSDGQTLLDDIAWLTGADVAASDDFTGSPQFGGDWELEYEQGKIEAHSAINSQIQENWNGVLVTFTVNSTTDTLDVNPGDGFAEDAAGETSLRAAIMEANALAGADEIVLNAGNYQLSLTGAGENAAASGDLDVTDNLTLTGAGAYTTSIDGAGADRVFEVRGAAVTITGVTIQNGSEVDGAGIRADGASVLTIRDAAVSDNAASSTGGGLLVSGTLTTDRVTIEGNSADLGGGLYVDSGAVATLRNTTLSGNSALSNGGAIFTTTTVDIINSTIAQNTGLSGGGIYTIGPGSASLQNTILAYNVGGNSNSALTSLGHNIDSDGTTGISYTGDQSGVDPRLGPLQYNGGFTQTHALLAGSPAIDPAGLSGAPSQDQRGFTRDGAPDIGAFEYGAVSGSTNQAPVVNDQILAVDENAANGTPVGTVAATDSGPADNYTMLYWVDVQTDELRRINLDGTGNEQLAIQADGTVATGMRSVAVDDVNGKVYWINNNSDQIWRANLDGSSPEQILGGIEWPMGIAVDAAGEKIYWFDNDARELWWADLDGSNAAALITIGINHPKALTIDAGGGKLYWTDWELNTIMRANLDGSNLETVVAGLDDPYGIALDISVGKVYWAEAMLGEIQRADMVVGAKAETVVSGLIEPRAVAVDTINGKLYYADSGANRIERANLDGSAIEIVTATGDWPIEFAIGPPVQNLTYAIAGGNTNSAFTIDSVTGEITVANSSELDFETTPVFNLTVTVTDAGGLADSAAITVDLTDVNEPPTIVTNAALDVPEEATRTITPAYLETTDPDNSPDQVIYTLTMLPTGGSVRLNGTPLTLGQTFTQEDINNNRVTYRDSDQGVTTSFQMTVSDGNTTLPAFSFSVIGQPINDAPVVSAPGSALSATEQVGLAIQGTGFSVSDPDEAGAGAIATLTVGEGTISVVAADSGVSVDSGDGTSTVTLSGSIAQLNDLLTGTSTGTITYLNNSDTPGANTTLTVTVNDQGNTGSDPGLTGDGSSEEGNNSVTINIASVNDAPVNSVPGPQSTSEETPLVFSSIDGNLISIADIDAGGNTVDVTLSVGNGTLTLNGTTGLVFSAGDGSADATMTFTGTVADINAALDGLTYTPDPQWNGAVILTLTTSDRGNTGLTPLDSDANLTTRYSFDVDGTDAVGGNDATLFNGAAVIADGERGNVLGFDGVDDYAEVPAGVTDGLSQFTFSFWVKTTESGTHTNYWECPTLFGMDVNGASNDLVIYTNNGFIGIFTGLSGTEFNYLSSTTQINDDEWHQITVSNDGANASFYVDGVFEVALASGNGLDSYAFYLGAQNFEGAVLHEHSGSFDDLRIFDRGLASAEVRDLYTLSDTDSVAITVNSVNDPGTVTIDNTTPVQGDSLTASVTDPEGATGAIAYQWYRGGVAIAGATSSTYTTVQADVGAAITVTATYTDDLGSGESPTSAPTAAVTNVNDPGTVTIDNMTPTQGDTLTASVSDPDGATGAINYQWYRGGVAIAGATANTYTTVQADVGAAITVTATYTDDLGGAESPTSAATAAVTNVNDVPALGNNNLTITRGATVTLDSSMLSATDADHPDPSLTFNVSGVTAGHFAFSSDTATPINSFDQSDISAGIVVFVHDGSETPPSYSVSVTDGIDSTAAFLANITFMNQNDTPLPDNEHPTIIEDVADLSDNSTPPVTDAEPSDLSPAADQTDFSGDTAPSVTSVDKGYFSAGTVVFVRDSSETPASHSVSVTDFEEADLDRSDSKMPNSRTQSFHQTLKLLLESKDLGELKTALGQLDITTLSPQDYELVRNSLDTIKEEIGKEILLGKTVLGSAIATSIGLSAGYVVWLLKGGSLLASVLSSLPAWQLADPLAILAGKKEDEDEDDESLETIIDDGSRPDEDKESKASELETSIKS